MALLDAGMDLNNLMSWDDLLKLILAAITIVGSVLLIRKADLKRLKDSFERIDSVLEKLNETLQTLQTNTVAHKELIVEIRTTNKSHNERIKKMEQTIENDSKKMHEVWAQSLLQHKINTDIESRLKDIETTKTEEIEKILASAFKMYDEKKKNE